ncbi:MAG: hypothetical protein M3P31_00395 [Actinomycetota bacterium]|nr:hypothetical protein [Actinomycetota bacterium]
MVDALATGLIVLSLALALWAAVCAALDRLPPKAHLQALFALQALVLVQAAIALVRAGQWGGSKAELIGYLAVSAVLVPGGLVLAVEERTRWGTLVLAAACLTLAVVVVRLNTVWAAGV